MSATLKINFNAYVRLMDEESTGETTSGSARYLGIETFQTAMGRSFGSRSERQRRCSRP